MFENKKTKAHLEIIKKFSLALIFKREQKGLFKNKKLAREMSYEATRWCRWWDSNPHDVTINGF